MLVTTAALFIVLAACSADGGVDQPDNDSTAVPVTPVPRPDGVPDSARPVDEAETFGRIVRQAGEPPEAIGTRNLLTAACEDDLMVLWTSEEKIHAALPCDRFWNTDAVQAFSGEQVAIRLEISGTMKYAAKIPPKALPRA